MTAWSRRAGERSAGRVPTYTGLVPWLLGTALVAVVVLALALLAGGGAPQPAPGGLPDAGPLTGWGLPVVELLANLAGFVAVGLALVGALLPGHDPAADDARSAAAGAAAVSAAAWAVLALLQSALQASGLLATPLLTLDTSQLGVVLGAVGDSRETVLLLVQAGLATAAALVGLLRRTPAVAAGALVLAVAAFVPTALAGHSATGNQLVGSASLVVHVSAAALWVGGLGALTWLAMRAPALLTTAVPRFSTLALGCVVAVTASGVVNAALRVGSWEALATTGYGVLVLLKVTAVAVLAVLGWLHRRHTVGRLRSARAGAVGAGVLPAFVALAVVEVVVMAMTVALGVGLSRTPPPVDTATSTATATGGP